MTQLVRRSPWWMADFDPDMGRLLGRAFGAWLDPRWYRLLPLARDRWMPACDVFVRGGDLVVRMELPGIDPDVDVQVTVEDGGFQRGVPLPDTVSVDDIKATYNNGVLEVVVPKFAALSEPKRVPVHAGTQGQSLPAGGA